jgi:hypothetical protein
MCCPTHRRSQRANCLFRINRAPIRDGIWACANLHLLETLAVFSNQTLPVYPGFVCRFFELDEEKLPKPSEFDLFKL